MQRSDPTPTQPELQDHHEWDLASCFCTRCGLSAMASIDRGGEERCYAPDNLLAVSHRIAHRRMSELLKTRYGDRVSALPYLYRPLLAKKPHPTPWSNADNHDGIEHRHLLAAVQESIDTCLSTLVGRAEARLAREVERPVVYDQPLRSDAVYNQTSPGYGAPWPDRPPSEPA